MNSLAPIALFAFNRPAHTRKTLQALAQNSVAASSTLYCFVDGPRNSEDQPIVDEVRRVVSEASGFADVRISIAEHNQGLARSVIGGVSQVIAKHGRAIAIEDDLITAPSFLAYMNDALSAYEARTDIFSISGYRHPRNVFQLPASYQADVFLSRRNSTWGWASWLDRWAQVDWEITDYSSFCKDPERRARFARGGRDLPGMLDLQMAGKIDSWGIRFSYAHFAHEAYAVYPTQSLVDNIGHDGTGVHCNTDGRFRNDLREALETWALPVDICPDPEVIEAFRRIYEPTAWMKTKNMIKRLVGREGAA